MKQTTKAIAKKRFSSPSDEFLTIEFQPVNSDKIFTVRIPRRIREAVHTIALDEAKKIWGSLEKLAQEIQADGKPTLPLLERLYRITRWNFPELLSEEKTGLKGTSLALASAGLLGVPYAKEDALWWLRFQPGRVLNGKTTSRLLRNAVRQAIFDNDVAFFASLGRLLSNPPKPVTKSRRVNPLKALMLWHWMDMDEVGLSFCYFTDEALADFLAKVAPFAGPTFGGVRQTRKRLGLSQTKRRLVKKVEQRGDAIFLS